jgi:hypothetical protein
LSFSRSSILFFSITRSFALSSSISFVAAALLGAGRGDATAVLDGLVVVCDLVVVAGLVAVEPVSFSSAMVLDWTGLVSGGDIISSSLLFGPDAALLELER